jgi:hypothetical protein
VVLMQQVRDTHPLQQGVAVQFLRDVVELKMLKAGNCVMRSRNVGGLANESQVGPAP